MFRVFRVNNKEHISHLVLVSLLLNFKQVNAGWVVIQIYFFTN